LSKIFVFFLVPIFDQDDLLGSVTADDRGVFCVRGFTTEATDIEPYIYIEHNCGYEGLDQKVFPSEFVSSGNFSKKTYHMGDIELLTKGSLSSCTPAHMGVDEPLPTWSQQQLHEETLVNTERHENDYQKFMKTRRCTAASMQERTSFHASTSSQIRASFTLMSSHSTCPQLSKSLLPAMVCEPSQPNKVFERSYVVSRVVSV
uniref:Transthyretin-like family protein n=1 Tax=Heligmosomoides polygyrus TaxID=6339 RepID=A0A183G585_HELPZ